jgi:hypothetical protein
MIILEMALLGAILGAVLWIVGFFIYACFEWARRQYRDWRYGPIEPLPDWHPLNREPDEADYCGDRHDSKEVVRRWLRR